MRLMVIYFILFYTFSCSLFSVCTESEVLGHLFLNEISQTENPRDILPEIIEFLQKANQEQGLLQDQQDLRELMIQYETNKRNALVLEKREEATSIIDSIKKDPNIHEIVKDRVYYQVIKPSSGFNLAKLENHHHPLFHLFVKTPSGSVLMDTSNQGPVYQDLQSAIKGFSLGVKGMTEGEKRRLYIHPDYGYGNQSLLSEPSLLIMEVDLVRRDL